MASNPSTSNSSPDIGEGKQGHMDDLKDEITAFIRKEVEKFELNLKRRRIVGSSECAVETLRILRHVVSRGKFKSAANLIKGIKIIGRRLSAANRTQLTIGNAVRRVLHLIRQVCAEEKQDKGSKEGPVDVDLSRSLVKIMDNAQSVDLSMEVKLDLRQLIIEEISELVEDIKRVYTHVKVVHYSSTSSSSSSSSSSSLVERCVERRFGVRRNCERQLPIFLYVYVEILLLPYFVPWNNMQHFNAEMGKEAVAYYPDNCIAYSVEHIHAKDVILTVGMSTTVMHFLSEAAKLEREFEVIVAESAPAYDGHQMAKELAKKNIETTLVTDSAVFAMMGIVNKVIIGSHLVLANGGLISRSGCHMVAAAAHHHSVPVVCVTGLYKLCPLYGFDQDSFNDFKYPGEILKFQEKFAEKVNVQNPGHDYIPPELVSLLITNFGGNSPSYVYRLLTEYYDVEDYDL
eukprot:jgi/Bigna1/86521/estExt_fgenesh1_pg.C_110095